MIKILMLHGINHNMFGKRGPVRDDDARPGRNLTHRSGAIQSFRRVVSRIRNTRASGSSPVAMAHRNQCSLMIRTQVVCVRWI